MKNIIFITFLMISMLASGQEYQPFIDRDKEWNIMFTDIAYGGSPATKTTLTVQISANDTIINDTVYRLVINTGHSSEPFPSGIGFIREDIAERKVYFREKTQVFTTPKERLLYNFSLEPGDTTEIFGLLHCEWFSNTFKVVSIDKVTLLNDEERKVWYLESIGDKARETDTWIEGIGSLNGMLFPGCYQLATISFSLDLLCYFEEGLKLYMSDADTCFVDWSSGMEIYAEDQVKIYPNPTQGEIYLAGDTLNIKHLAVYDFKGRLLYMEFERNYLDISHFNNGIYLLVIEYNNGDRIVSKIIKTNKMHLP